MSKQVYLWKQKDGTLIDVDQMSINHLRNTLKMLMRNNDTRKKSLQSNTFKLNGDMANEFNDNYIEDEYSEMIDEVITDFDLLNY
jgi:hypothetical protein